MNKLLIDALLCRNSAGRPPVWLMRQAGRYMPQYRALREKYSFLEMCRHPELITKVTLQPIQAFGMDAAILFSDILLIAEALGVGLRFDEGLGPIIERPLSTGKDVDALPKVNVQQGLGFVGNGIRMVKPELKVPLLGFCGAPFTVASYMIEGKSSKDLRKTKQWMLAEPQTFHKLLGCITQHSLDYLDMQITAGVDAIQLFDSWANVLGHCQFREFSLSYLDKMVRHVKGKVPVIVFCRGSSVFAPQLAEIAPNAISLDWNCDLGTVRRQTPASIALQGNLDPDVLYAPLPVIKNEVKNLLKAMHGEKGYVFNLGHGITPQVSTDAVRMLVDTVKEV